MCIATEESYFILKYSSEAVAKGMENRAAIPEDGIEEAFDVVGEIGEVVKTGNNISYFNTTSVSTFSCLSIKNGGF